MSLVLGACFLSACEATARPRPRGPGETAALRPRGPGETVAPRPGSRASANGTECGAWPSRRSCRKRISVVGKLPTLPETEPQAHFDSGCGHAPQAAASATPREDQSDD